jgi:hypothetical protein
MYFNKLGTTIYNNITIPDILKRIVVHEDLSASELVNQYTIVENETPESVSFNYYGKVDYYWTIMLINNIKSRFFDWPLNSLDLGKHITVKYGNKTAIYFTEDQFQSKQPMCKSKYIIIEQKKYNVHECDRNLNKIVVDKINAADINANYPITVSLIVDDETNGVSMNTQKIDYENELAVHHFEGNESSPRQFIQEYITGNIKTNAILNYDYEVQLNENKRQIVLIKPDYISLFVNEFTKIANE